MGITQHEHGVANVQEIVNLLLLRGNIGVPGAGPCPVRGHCNVQGDRTVGHHRAAGRGVPRRGSAREFGFEPPRAPGFDTRRPRSARCATAGCACSSRSAATSRSATPDTEVTAAALERCDLTVQVSTKLNRSHLRCGREAYVLPCLGRSERDLQHGRARSS